jgi:AAA domain
MTTGSFQRGSEWRKWDLHIHSPCSLLNNQYPKKSDGEPDWEPFLAKLESTDIAVLGITDYFTIEGYKALRQFKEEGRIPQICTILPNIEFRLATIVPARSGREVRVNLHVILSDDLPPDDIEEHFLHNLDFYYQGNPGNPDELMKLRISNLEALGKKLLGEHKRFRESGKSPLEVGAMNAVVRHEEITEVLSKDSRFRGKYLIVLAADGWDEIDWDGQGHNVRKGLLQKSHMVFSANSQERAWCLGARPYEGGPEGFVKEFKTLKPCIHGCDAHRLKDIGRPCSLRGAAAHDCEKDAAECDMRYCWIKADPTFEGLKQLLYEPNDRVAIQAPNPLPVISNLTIGSIVLGGAVVNDELSVSDAQLELTPALVAVVGGKGAGKTALVDLVAHCYMDRGQAADRNSFVRRIQEFAPDLNTTLEFRDGRQFSKAFGDQHFLDDTQIVYIAQGELEEYIGESSDLEQRIQDLIFESDAIKNSLLSFDSEEAGSLTESIERKLAAENQTIEELEEDTREDLERSIEREKGQIGVELDDVDNRIEEIEKLQTEEARKEAEERQERVGSLKARQETLALLKAELETIQVNRPGNSGDWFM